MTRRTSFRVAIIGGTLAILLAGCASNSVVGGSTCDEAFAQAMAVDPGSDTTSAFDGAIATCPSLEAWVSAASRYPDTTAGQDPVAFAITRCTATPGIADSLVCVGLPGESAP